ncbi:4'-phosphopantetheinyl transferase family protein [Modestobacter sp. SYSU DS0875]
MRRWSRQPGVPRPGGSGNPGTCGTVPRGNRSGAVVVWQAALDLPDVALEAASALLSPPERARADRGTEPVRRRRIALRAALRTAAARELGCSPAEVPLTTGPSGRPEVPGPAAGLDVTCTASGTTGLVAVGRGVRVGIDLERVTPWAPELLEDGWLSEREAVALLALPAGERATAAARAWAGKEAVLKAGGWGLTVAPALVEPGFAGTPVRVGGWTVTGLVTPPGTVGRLACSRRRPLRRGPLVPRPLELVPAAGSTS